MLNHLQQRFGLNEAVGFALASRLWQVVSAPLTQALLLLYFTDEGRGFYFMFLTIIQMQVFVELGLKVVLINVASHEWSHLSYVDGRLQGSDTYLNRLGSLWFKSMWWYLLAGMVFMLAIGLYGYSTLAEGSNKASLLWNIPWIAFVLVYGLHLIVAPMIGILEGCGQINVINRFRFVQAVAGSLVMWTMLCLDLGLWCLVGAATVTLLTDAWIACVKYRGFFGSLIGVDWKSGLSWRDEVLPLQWRVGLQGPLTWLANSMPGVVIFVGGNMASQWLQTWYIVSTLQAACASWIDSNRPEIGRLLAARQQDDAMVLWQRTLKVSLGLLSLLIAGMVLTLLVLPSIEWTFGDKIVAGLLPWPHVLALGLAILVMHVCHCMNVFGLAHKQDVFFRYAVATNCVKAAVLFFAGRAYGVNGVVFGVMGVTLGLQLPLYLIRWRQRDTWTHEALSNG